MNYRKTIKSQAVILILENDGAQISKKHDALCRVTKKKIHNSMIALRETLKPIIKEHILNTGI